MAHAGRYSGSMSIATDMRDKYIIAETAILGGQWYRSGDRQFTRVRVRSYRERRWMSQGGSDATT